MDSGNAAKVVRMFELWSEGRLEEAVGRFHPQIEWREPPETIGRNVVVGAEAARVALESWVDQFDSLRGETTELREEGDRVLHAMEQFARVRGSTVEVTGQLFMVWWFRDGRPVRMEMYNHREQAEVAFAR